MAKPRRDTKLGMGDVGGPATQAARMRRSVPPPTVNCPAPRVPTFDVEVTTGTHSVLPKSGGRKRKTAPQNYVDEIPPSSITSASKVLIPRPSKKKRDLAGAPIDNREAFLLTRVDGHLNVEDLADLTGMPISDVGAIVQRLARLGLIIV